MIPYFFPPKPIRLWPDSPLIPRFQNRGNYDAEIKHNGWRLLIFKTGGKLSFYNRYDAQIDINVDPFLDFFHSYPMDTVFDGELLNFRTKELKNTLVLWDCVFFKTKDLRSEKLSKRRQFLADFPNAPNNFTASTKAQVFKLKQYKKFLDLYYEIENKHDPIHEGIVIKDINSPYTTSLKRCPDITDWYKVKKVDDSNKVTK